MEIIYGLTEDQSDFFAPGGDMTAGRCNKIGANDPSATTDGWSTWYGSGNAIHDRTNGHQTDDGGGESITPSH